jgi:hypothetical protein
MILIRWILVLYILFISFLLDWRFFYQPTLLNWFPLSRFIITLLNILIKMK